MDTFKVLHSKFYGDPPGVVAAGLTAVAAEEYVAHHGHLQGLYVVEPERGVSDRNDSDIIQRYRPGGDDSTSVAALAAQNEQLKNEIANLRSGMDAALEAKFQTYIKAVAAETVKLQREAQLPKGAKNAEAKGDA